MGRLARRRYKHRLTGVAARLGRSYRPGELRGAAARIVAGPTRRRRTKEGDAG